MDVLRARPFNASLCLARRRAIIRDLAKSFHLPKYANGPLESLPCIFRRVRVKNIQVGELHPEVD